MTGPMIQGGRLGCALPVLALAVCACSSSVNSVQRDVPSGTPTRIVDRRVITDRDLDSAAQVVELRQATVSGDLLMVQAELENTQRSTRNVTFKFEWFDANGMEVGTPLSAWRTCVLRGGERTTITGVAPSPMAKDFRLKLERSKGD